MPEAEPAEGVVHGREPDVMPASRSTSLLSSASVMSGVASTSALSLASCGSSSGRLCPP